ncbi:putative disease resistance protein RGA4 [Hordeum vulgare]|nr:putative disease resistance protein RGA4 [Hordeum vulgare]
MVYAALSAAQWVVGKALAPVADGLLGAWAATNNFGPNVNALSTELLLVKATLEQAALKELGGRAMEMLLQKLQDSAHNAEDLLDELDYFRIHDELHNTDDAADEHGKGCIRGLAFNARHTAKAVGKQVNCCPWQHAKRRQRSQGDSSSAPDSNQEVGGCMPKLSNLFTASSSLHPDVSADEGHGNAQQTPKLDFNRVDFSQRMKDIVEKLQPVRKDVNGILQGCGPRIAIDIAQRRPTTTPRSAEPKLYGRDRVMNSIIHDITEGQYCDKGLTVLPVVGPGGMGKTTLIQHIYHNQQVQNHFPVKIWICVSFNFNLDKVLQEIKRYTPVVEGEKESLRTEELIEQRLKSKRFLLILDDIWQFINVDDWNKLLVILGQTEEKGCMILVTTRFQAIAQMVKTTDHPKELNGLEPEEFRKLFLVFVFDDGQCPGNKLHFLDKIMEKLKGSPLAAKTVGRLLRTDPSTGHWRRVLNSKEWENDNNGIMSALKLSYDFLPFHLQRCFFYSALFPEDYRFRSRELISLWVGLDILTPCSQNTTFEGGLRILNDLVIHGFFREEETDGDLRYVMHDLLHELALEVASNDCLSLRLPNVGSVKIQPTTRHLSISIDDLGKYDVVSGEKLKSELEILKTRLKVEHLQTLMLFGKMDEGFVKIFGDFFGEANALRVLHFPNMLCPVESMLHNFSRLFHLRYLCLGTKEWQMHLPLSISKFYHLRILDLELWDGSRDLSEDMSNLAKLCHLYVPSGDLLHFDIYNVGKLKLLEELKVFRVNKREEGFEPKQLEHLTKLRELGIYNLDKIHTEEEAAQAKLMEKKNLRRLTLCWDSERSSVEPGFEAVVLESLQPHADLQVMCIRGHGGPSCPTWLGDEFAVEGLQSLYLDGVSWEVFPSLGKAWDLHELRFENIARLEHFIIEKSFCMLTQLILIGLGSFVNWVYTGEQDPMFPFLQVLIIRECPRLLGLPFPNHIVPPDWFPKLQMLMLLAHFWYSKSSNGAELEIIGEAGLHSIDQMLVFDKETGLERLTLDKCPPLELKHLLMLTSLKTLFVKSSVGLVGPLGGVQSDVEWQLPFEYIRIDNLNGNTGKELTELLPHLPKLSKLAIWNCKNIKKLVASEEEDDGVGVQQTTSAASEEEDDGVVHFPPRLCDSLRELLFDDCTELVLVDPSILVPGGGWLQALQCLQRLTIQWSPKFLSAFSVFCHIFPSSLQSLELLGVQGMGTLEPLSNLSSLTRLELYFCGEDLKCQGLWSLVTTGGQLNKLDVRGSHRFFAHWDPNPRRALEIAEGGEEQQKQLVSSTLRELWTDDAAGLLTAHVCRFLSSSLTKLTLYGDGSDGMKRFSKEQEDALQLLSTLQELEFWCFKDLQQLPAGLRNLTSLKLLSVKCCPAISSLPNDALPDSLENLDVYKCSEELKQYCRGLEGTILTFL